MIPKRDPYPVIQDVPEHIVIRARQMVAKRVNPEAKWFYMQGKGDHYTVVQAVIEALMGDTPSAAIPPRSGQPGTGKAPPRSCQAATFPQSVPRGESAVGCSFAAHESGASAAPFPTPQAHPSQASAGNSALSANDLSALPLSIDPAFFAAWRESQGQTVDAEAR